MMRGRKALSRRWIWVAAVALIVMLVLPMPIAERYTSPTQDGQYLFHPATAYRFVFAAAGVSRSSSLGSSGKALERAKQLLATSDIRPSKVELLFLPQEEPYVYETKSGRRLTARPEGRFLWEVWGTTVNSDSPDVVALLDYVTGDMLASVKQ